MNKAAVLSLALRSRSPGTRSIRAFDIEHHPAVHIVAATAMLAIPASHVGRTRLPLVVVREHAIFVPVTATFCAVDFLAHTAAHSADFLNNEGQVLVVILLFSVLVRLLQLLGVVIPVRGLHSLARLQVAIKPFAPLTPFLFS